MKLPKLRALWSGATLQRDLDELRDALQRYLKDETVVPLRAMGRFLVYGALGSVFVGFGLILLLVGALRYLQWQFRFLDGTESWIPYFAVVLLGICTIVLVLWRIFAGVGARRIERE